MKASTLDQLPAFSKYDPGETGEGSLDPLGLGAVADRIADRLAPGLRARMTRPRFVTISALGAHACQSLSGVTSTDGKTTFDLAFEWLVVESLAQHPQLGRPGQPPRLVGLPGSQKVIRARAAHERLSAATYLAGARVFGFTGVHLVRFTDLQRGLDVDGLWAGITGKNRSGINFVARWTEFARRIASATPHERQSVLDALLGDQGHDDSEPSTRGARLSPVRRATGQTRREDRERLIAVFNTPFLPDILIASSVMGEGIDLHQSCRHVIHHDLDWNPSRLEQRTGRLDRIGALAERERRSIEVFEPYLAGTHDEKMFRVVKDRAGWFDIVMGRAVGADESVTDAEETRVPLHSRIHEALSIDLRSR